MRMQNSNPSGPGKDWIITLSKWNNMFYVKITLKLEPFVWNFIFSQNPVFTLFSWSFFFFNNMKLYKNENDDLFLLGGALRN